jgi:hypothetical protein
MTANTGRCMCGGVRFTAAELRDVFNCHCHRCRRFTGHHMAATGTAADNVVFAIDDTLTWYSPEPTVEYGFCNRCGSSLFWRTSARSGWLSICAGSLDQPTGLRTAAAWWMAEHADYHTPDPGLIETEYDG